MVSKRFWSAGRVATTVTAALLLTFAPAIAFSAGGQEIDEVEPGVWDGPQAPELAALVDAGELPPLEERIPENPKVVQPRDEIGQYGGQARSALIGGADGGWLVRSIGYDGMVLWDKEWSRIRPGAVSTFDVSEDAKEFTFELRRGLRWHDGERFTSADVEWWFNHELLHADLTPAISDQWKSAGELAELEILDEETFRFVFAEPNPLFLDELASEAPWVPTGSHYAQRFHADFNDDIHDIAREEGFDDWVDYYGHMITDGSAKWRNPDLPSIMPWTPVAGEGYTGDVTRVRFERNPYYYRVDSEGNQLPYIDGWTYDLIEDPEVLLLRTMAGEVDLMYRHINRPGNRPILYENKASGNYRFFETQGSHTNQSRLNLNMTHDDETVRALARNRDFRIGLSHAINREEISELVHAGMSEPRQPAPHSSMPWYHEELERQYLEYDPDLAEEYFERAGFERDDRGRWLGPDGEPISILLDVIVDFGDLDVWEIVAEQWRDVGIELVLNVIDRSLFHERESANTQEAAAWMGQNGLRDGLVGPINWVPYHPGSRLGPRWTAWYGASLHDLEPEEPPQDIKRLFELWDEIQITADPDRQNELLYEIMDIHAQNFYLIGTVGIPPGYGIVHNRIGNAPHHMPSSWDHASPGPSDFSQFYIREE